MFTLYLHDTDGNTQEIVVSPSDPIKRLDINFKNGQRPHIIFDNHLIVSDFTFSFYGIKNGDHLYLMPNTTGKSNQMTSPFLPERFNEAQKRFNMAQSFHPESDHSFVLESVRLKDQYFNKIESNYYLNRAVMARTFEAEQTVRKIKHTKLITDFKKLSKPSTTALPKFW
ncbi:hypothetical protein TVAG_215140 [Trichomonas vaginalis G3]|uniref:Ubiquitin-like domain-containing protein n=1 Tax=Trichomonas vaginalis (strain ATCC PRA-98 / G3) TaxID=412133 RepID=A2F644_TRIV3|nr:ubiquitin-like family [Trichomonas vaginalis G3]EAX99614.1 hypothetical protein TVAG_215140 [Trichomonas vaginalis G3]KAI5532130.1 ubiquitin-like family [Trichomonas vaginalis G3]|eukprot:XP_001312544.1 hypothetical protein [Trichomonas vaginalis G3]